MAHTPGNWQTFERSADAAELGHFSVWLGDFELPCISNEILTFDDAVLIAAAPDLLEALREIYACGSVEKAKNIAAAAIYLATAALKKQSQ